MDQEQQWLQEYDINDLSRALIREYLIQNKLTQTLQVFENQTQSSHKKITKSALIKCLFLGSLFHNNKNKEKPLKSLLEILVQYLKNKFEQKFTKEKTKQQSTGIMSEKNSQTQSRVTHRQHQDALDIKLLQTKNMESNMKKKTRPQTANPKKDSLKTFEQKLMANNATDFTISQNKEAKKVSTDNRTKNEIQMLLVKEAKKNDLNKITSKEQNVQTKQYEQDYDQQWQKQEQKFDDNIAANQRKEKTVHKVQNFSQKPTDQSQKHPNKGQQFRKTQEMKPSNFQQKPKNSYQQIKKKAEQTIQNLQLNAQNKPKEPLFKQQISQPLRKQMKEPQISSRMGGMRKMGMKKVSEKKIQSIQPVTCTTHQSKTQHQEALPQKLTPIAQYQKENPKKQSVSKNQANEKKMVSVFGKKKKEGKKQEPYECKKFRFDDNFVDAPLRTVNQKYQYQPFRLHQITVAIKIQQSIAYTSKPQVQHNNHAINKKKTQKNLTQFEVEDLKKLIFQYNSPILPKSWHQGFILSPHSSTPYGLKQIQGGPCGIIAAVQCFYLKHLLFYSKPTSEQDIKNENRRQICLVAALTDILMKVKSTNKLILAIPPKSFVGGSKLDLNSLVQVTIDADNFKSAFQGVWNNKQAFIGHNNHGVAVLMYSIVTTKGIQNIKKQMDCEQNPLIGNHGHCTQQLVNLFITGKAVSNCFDGEKMLQDNYKLKGIEQKAQFGFLTIFETLKYIEVGKNLKNPIYPIWIICKQFHYHVIFANHYLIAENNDAEKFDMIYFDGLYNCGDKIIITLQRYHDVDESQIKIKQLPLIQQVMMTKWGLMKSDWNGSVRIL